MASKGGGGKAKGDANKVGGKTAQIPGQQKLKFPKK